MSYLPGWHQGMGLAYLSFGFSICSKRKRRNNNNSYCRLVWYLKKLIVIIATICWRSLCARHVLNPFYVLTHCIFTMIQWDNTQKDPHLVYTEHSECSCCGTGVLVAATPVVFKNQHRTSVLYSGLIFATGSLWFWTSHFTFSGMQFPLQRKILIR